MDNTQPLSKRSKRILEEASRHITFGVRRVESLSVEEFEALVTTCASKGIELDLGDCLDDLRRLRRAIAWHVGARG